MRAALEAPSRWAVRVAKQVPRASAFASRARASASTRSNGEGILRRRSSPLALTLLTSKAQRQAPLDPAARPKPVMLFTAILADPFARRAPRDCSTQYFGRHVTRRASVHLEFRQDPADCGPKTAGVFLE